MVKLNRKISRLRLHFDHKSFIQWQDSRRWMCCVSFTPKNGWEGGDREEGNGGYIM